MMRRLFAKFKGSSRQVYGNFPSSYLKLTVKLTRTLREVPVSCTQSSLKLSVNCTGTSVKFTRTLREVPVKFTGGISRSVNENLCQVYGNFAGLRCDLTLCLLMRMDSVYE